MAGKLSPMQREQLGLMLLRKASEIVEFWDEMKVSSNDYFMLGHVDANEAAAQLHTWLKRVPSEYYPTNLLPEEDQ